MSSIISGFTNILNFNGNTNRKDFWIYLIVVAIISYFFSYAIVRVISSLPFLGWFSQFILFIILTAALICRRLHDIGWPGILTIVAFIISPLILVIGLIPGKNR
jgi:uncharacterized membrane protein YhaH (DUF805 family)